jgi:hypothetical protein
MVKDDHGFLKKKLGELEIILGKKGLGFFGDILVEFYMYLSNTLTSDIHQNQRIREYRQKIEGLFKFANATYAHNPQVDSYKKTYTDLLKEKSLALNI